MVLCSHLLGGSYMMKHGGHWSVQLRNDAKGKLSSINDSTDLGEGTRTGVSAPHRLRTAVTLTAFSGLAMLGDREEVCEIAQESASAAHPRA